MPEENPTAAAESSTETASGEAAPGPTTIVAKPSKWYRGKFVLMSIGLIAAGFWFMHDGFTKWPAENAQDIAAKKSPRHKGYDIPANQILGVALPPLGLFWLIATLYRTRGEYRLDGESLSIPGHPPIPLSSIQTVDRRKWDRKGIALMEYKTEALSGKFRLDDFMYDRDPTDEIFKRIEIAVSSPG